MDSAEFVVSGGLLNKKNELIFSQITENLYNLFRRKGFEVIDISADVVIRDNQILEHMKDSMDESDISLKIMYGPNMLIVDRNRNPADAAYLVMMGLLPAKNNKIELKHGILNNRVIKAIWKFYPDKSLIVVIAAEDDGRPIRAGWFSLQFENLKENTNSKDWPSLDEFLLNELNVIVEKNDLQILDKINEEVRDIMGGDK